MYTITITNFKGGVGKSTTAINLSYTFSKMGYRVLVIDLDAQCNCTSIFAKVNNDAINVKAILEEPEKINSIIRRTRFENLDIIKGYAKVYDEEEDYTPDVYGLKKAFGYLNENHQYDFCIIDTHPNFDATARNALICADLLLTPIIFDSFCRDNLAHVEEYINTKLVNDNPNVEWKIFGNKVALRKAQIQAMQDITECHSYPIMNTCITQSSVIDNALVLYKPAAQHRRNSHVAHDYQDLALEILNV